jgi:hypothetical protein
LRSRASMRLRKCISRKETAYECNPSGKMEFELCQPAYRKGYFAKRR